ncbi:MAG TPA: FAD-binding oxidoreductase, partial [Candidatus Saccharimonadia bacterium]
GAVVIFPAHMNRILRLSKDGVTVQPGVSIGTVQMALHTQGRVLAPFSSNHYSSTLGGAVATNGGGGKSLKYGSVAAWVKRLKVVLDDGSIIETRRVSRREVDRKKGIMTREGDLYRGIDGILQDHAGLIKESQLDVGRNTAGYRLSEVRGSGGSIDLSQLFIGSEGTLGLITEITLVTERYEPRTTLVAGYFDDAEAAGEAILRLLKLHPSRIEFVGQELLDVLYAHQPQLVAGVLPENSPHMVVMAEFDAVSHLRQNLLGRRAERLMGKLATGFHITTSRHEQSRLWEMRAAAMVILNSKQAPNRPVPIIDDVCVPVHKVSEFLVSTHKLLKKHKRTAAVWGHGNGVMHIVPYMNLAKSKDRAEAFKLMDEFYGTVIKMGGTTAAERGDGVVKGPYLERLYGREMADVLQQVKTLCDPNGIFNPEIKLGANKTTQENLLRQEFSTGHPYDHLPHR